MAREKGHCRAGGRLAAKFLSNARVEAGGDVVIHSEISNCRVTCGGRLLLEHGPLLASHITANGGVTVHTLGAPSGIGTVIEAAVDQHLQDAIKGKIAHIEEQRHKILHTRHLVEPLMRNAKALNAAQREKATELLYEADEMEAEVEKALAAIRQASEASAARAKPEVLVTSLIHPGVMIRLGDLETQITSPMKGPVKITTRTIENVRCIVAANTLTSSFRALETRVLHDETRAAMQRLLADANGQKSTETAAAEAHAPTPHQPHA